MAMAAQLDREHIIPFLMAGKATFTLRSVKTGKHYTFRSYRLTDNCIVFNVNTGQLANAYRYCAKFRPTLQCLDRKGTAGTAIAWFIRMLHLGKSLDQVELWHEGRCGKCG